VAFSSHDEVGDDVRRRYDDPDITWVDSTHPVVYAGAGSHAGAYLSGEYLVRVEPPGLQRWFATSARIREVLFRWIRGRPRTGLGIPYLDYKRGDGPHLGPGTDHPWAPVLVDAGTPWVRDYPGLWGLDTDDPFGGERAPAGPRYERGGTVRESLADPVAWAGPDPVPPNRQAKSVAETARLADLARLSEQVSVEIQREQQELRRLSVGAASLPPRLATSGWGRAKALTPLEEQTRRLKELRATRRAVIMETEHLRRAHEGDYGDVPPHAHLRRRTVPDVGPQVSHGVLLRFWTEGSLSVMLPFSGLRCFSISPPSRRSRLAPSWLSWQSKQFCGGGC
jgi:hypothetical protein